VTYRSEPGEHRRDHPHCRIIGKTRAAEFNRKKNFHELAEYVPDGDAGPEISEKLDAIVRVAKSAKPPESPW
jgi:hypothetical protein